MVSTDSTSLDERPTDTASRGPRVSRFRRLTGNRLFMISAAVMLVTTAIVTTLALRFSDWHLAYTLDDAAIHLSIVKQFVHHGTWGVTSGRYESASSSPGWDLLLSMLTFVFPFAWNVLPLLLNVVAGLWLLWLFFDNQDFIDAGRLDRAALLLVLMLPVFVLFIPALALVGMEHTLHAALVVQALVLLQQLTERGDTRFKALMPFFVVLFLGSLVRYESVFVAVGCAVAIVAVRSGLFGGRRFDTRSIARVVVGTLAAAGAPVVAIGVVNKLYGEGFFPNSIVAKSTLKAGWARIIPTPNRMASTLQGDSLVLVLALIVLAYVISAAFGGRSRNVAIAIAYVVTVAFHVGYAQFGGNLPYVRYQAYLVIAGTFVVFRIAGELLAGRERKAAVVFGILAVFILSTIRIQLTYDAPIASQNTYRQRYQLGKFFEKYYNGRPIATGELGYVTLFHDGPVVDFFGLGDHEVLQELKKGHNGGQDRGDPNSLSKQFLSSLIKRRHVVAIGVYTTTLRDNIPPDWILSGEWSLQGRNVTAFSRVIQFWAPTTQLSNALNDNLKAFDRTLPPGVKALSREDLIARFTKQLKKFGVQPNSSGTSSTTRPGGSTTTTG